MTTTIQPTHRDPVDPPAGMAVIPGLVDTTRGLTLGWLWLAVYSLIAAGLMSLLLALSRTPLVQNLLENPALFRVALVVHVDLSALIWFFACAGLLWSLLATDRPNLWDRVGLTLMAVGTLMISVAPFVGTPQPVMNNYVPVLQHPWFFAGLLVASLGLAVQAFRYLHSSGATLMRTEYSPLGVVRLAMGLTAVIMAVALACAALAYMRMPEQVTGEVYFELLFWGAGHVLQFAYTVMLLASWMVLVTASGSPVGLPWRYVRVLFVLAAMPLLAVPFLYAHPLDSREHILGFTQLMRWGGLASLPLGLLAFIALLRRGAVTLEGRCLRGAALCSMGLFAAGGLTGFMIRGSNTMIPAHYHGAIVAVTLGLMGLIYFVLPRLGRKITLPRVAYWQPYVYAAGQLMHLTGLAWSGGYGVQRKVSGAAQGLESVSETAGMALMGLGGLVSVAGGMLFLIIAVTALIARTSTRNDDLRAPANQVFMRS